MYGTQVPQCTFGSQASLWKIELWSSAWWQVPFQAEPSHWYLRHAEL